MRRVLRLCSPGLDIQVARRLAIEIAAEQAEEDFRGCAEAIERPVSDYHEVVASAVARS
jgi:hypothetical protein